MATSVILPPTNDLETPDFNKNYILFWNNVALDLVRLTTTSVIQGPQGEPPATARALAILHLAINDAYFAVNPDPAGVSTTYLTPNSTDLTYRLPPLDGATDARLAVAGAANTALQQLFGTRSTSVSNAGTDALVSFLQSAVNGIQPVLDTLSRSYRFGVAVGQAMLNALDIKPGEIGFDQDSYQPMRGVKYRFDDDPTNPIRIVPVDINNPNGPKKAIRVYDAPFYGLTAKRIAVQGVVDGQPTKHILADPPEGAGQDDFNEYEWAFDDVYREGGNAALNSTKRTPAQTTTGFFWAYDGANLIGTPLRHYNQILRQIAWDRKPSADPTSEANNADFARLFALVNAAGGDAGIFSWLGKYNFQFWRPLSGVREDAGNPLQDPFWLTLGAPNTNTNQPSFKPPFPSYPSGHATFGGAMFQAMRLYYKRRDNLPFAPHEPDNISFTVTSDELNGISRDLRDPYDPTRPITDQVGTVRTRVIRTFPSMWDAIFDNALSRVFLGVHWAFDAFSSKDALASTTVNANGTTAYKASQDVRYQTLGPRGDEPSAGAVFPIGGVPLGIGIANDIFQSNLKPTPASFQPNGHDRTGIELGGTTTTGPSPPTQPGTGTEAPPNGQPPAAQNGATFNSLAMKGVQLNGSAEPAEPEHHKHHFFHHHE